MKKILSIVLCLCLVLGLAACGNKPSEEEITDAREQSEQVKEEREQTLERVEEEEEKEEEIDVTAVLGGPLDYKMVELGTEVVDGKQVYAFAVQLPPAIEDVSYQLSVTDKEGNLLRLKEDSGVTINSFESAIITDEYKKEMFEDFAEQLEEAKEDPDAMKYGYEYPYAIPDDDCTSLIVYVLTSDNPIDMSNYLVTLKRGQTWGNISEEMNLTFKGTVEDIDFAPYFISGPGLIKLNGKYMLLNSGSSGIGGSGIASYQIYHFYDLFNMNKGKKDITPYTAVPIEWYFGEEKVELKEGWSVHFVVESNYDGDFSYEIGVTGPESDIEEMEKFVDENKPCLMTDNGPVILR